MDIIERLQIELLSKEWNNASEFVTYLLQNSEEEIPLSTTKELIRLADIQLKNEIPLKYFI